MKIRESFSFHELSKSSFYKDLLSEAIVSLYLNLFVTFALVTMNSQLYSVNMTHMGLLSGFGIYLLIEGYGPISGGHMNPSVSFTHCLAGRITVPRAVCYMLAQSGGGVLGSEIVYLLSPANLQDKFLPFRPDPSIAPWQGMLVEFVLTFNLLYVGLVASDVRLHKVYIPGAPTGLSVGVGIWAAGTWTGACQNPMVALGPAVISKDFRDHWIYWVGAYLAGAAAAGTHRIFYIARDKSKDRPLLPKVRDTPELSNGSIATQL